MALFIAKARQYRAKERVPGKIGVPIADLRASRAENQAINRLGELLSIRADEMKKERDAAVVGDLYNQWRDADREQLSQLLQKKGKDAVNLDRDYDQFFTKSQSKADEQAENGSQQAMINDKLSRRREDSLDILARYEANEGQRYKSKQFAGILANAKTDAVAASFDEQALIEKTAEVNTWLNFAYPGRSAEEKEAQENEIKKELMTSNMEGRIDEDATKAMETLEKWQEPLGENYVQLKKQAKTKQKQQLINSLQAELEVTKQKNGEPNFGAMRVSITSKENVTNDIKFEVRNWIDAYEAQYTNKKKSDFNSAALAEDQAIGNAYIDGDYQEVLRLIRASQYLKGAEKRTWKNAITEKNKSINTPIPRNEEASETMKIQDMVSNPYIGYQEVRNYIIQSNKLTNPDGMLNSIRTRYENANKEAIDEAEKYIKDLIIPTRTQRSKLLRATIETEAVTKSRNELQAWIETQQRKTGKIEFLTSGEIMKKAREIAISRKPSISAITEAINIESQLED